MRNLLAWCAVLSLAAVAVMFVAVRVIMGPTPPRSVFTCTRVFDVDGRRVSITWDDPGHRCGRSTAQRSTE